MLLPIDTPDLFHQARARSHGKWVDHQEWQRHAWDEEGNDRVANKDEDHMAAVSASLAHGEKTLREDGHINNPYALNGSARAEVSLSSSWELADGQADPCNLGELA
eukprot:762707-Hanusia_phi.AAC.3